MLIKKVTIRDVAEKAGVSYQTVSRVINQSPNVSDVTRQRILDVIDELGYAPNATARSLASRKTHTLGLIVPDFYEHVYLEAIIGAEMEAKKRGYFFLLGITDSDDREEPEYFRLLTERRVEGILFLYPSLATDQDHHYLDLLVEQQLPLVTIAYQARQRRLTIVNVDNVNGGFQATHCLIDEGHRHIGMITGNPLWQPALRRTEGYRQALAEAGITYDDRLVGAGDWSFDSGAMAVGLLLERAPHLTAIFAQNDQMAIGAIRALRAAGRRVPEDVAVIGYDDIPVARYYHPTLSSVSQPMRQVGQVAVRLLLDRIGDPHAEPDEVLLKPVLIQRESTGVGSRRKEVLG